MLKLIKKIRCKLGKHRLYLFKTGPVNKEVEKKLLEHFQENENNENYHPLSETANVMNIIEPYLVPATEDDMVERVARIICLAEGMAAAKTIEHNYPDKERLALAIKSSSEERWAMYVSHAKAAIAAMEIKLIIQN